MKAGAPSAGPATPSVVFWQFTEQDRDMLWMACFALFPQKEEMEKRLGCLCGPKKRHAFRWIDTEQLSAAHTKSTKTSGLWVMPCSACHLTCYAVLVACSGQEGQGNAPRGHLLVQVEGTGGEKPSLQD